MSQDFNTGTQIPGESGPVSEPIANEAPIVNREAPAADVPAAAPVDDIESRARANGWVPKEEFRGNPDQWRDAAEFVRRGEEELPILRERNKALAARLEQMERNFSDRIERLDRMNTLALQKQRETLEDSYRAAMREAVANGDVQRYDQLNRDLQVQLQNNNREIAEVIHAQRPAQVQNGAPQPVPGQPQQPNPAAYADPAIQAWWSRNRWMESDRELAQVAAIYSSKMERENPHWTITENLEATERYIKQQRYPDRFKPARPASVEGGSRVPSNTSRKRGASDLPADARAQADKFIKEGLYKSRDEYAQDYFAQEGV